MLKKGLGLGLVSVLMAGGPTYSQASDAVTFTYDALVKASHSGTVNGGGSSSYGYDAADNRANVTMSGASGGGNQPPVTQNDFGRMIVRCSGGLINVVANDTDNEGHVPLTLVSIQPLSPSSHNSAWVDSDTRVAIGTGWQTGTDQVTCGVQDSQGATSTGVVSFEVVGGPCLYQSDKAHSLS